MTPALSSLRRRQSPIGRALTARGAFVSSRTVACACWLAALACGHGDQSPGAPTSPQTTTTTPTGGGTNNTPSAPAATWNVATQGIPKFVTANYIDLTQLDGTGKPLIWAISKFRSSVGHAYGDRAEPCMSKKHYFMVPDSTTKIYAPVTGTLVYRDAGPSRLLSGYDNFEMQPDGYPAFVVTIFHVIPTKDWKVGDHFTAGTLLGHHTSKPTYSDIAVSYDDGLGDKGSNYNQAAQALISYFDVMADSVFRQYQIRGIASRADVQISKEERATWPLTCILGTDAFDQLGSWWPDKLATTVPVSKPTLR